MTGITDMLWKTIADFSNYEVSQDVIEIRKLYNLGKTQGSLAKQFGISQSTVSTFVHNIRRKLV